MNRTVSVVISLIIIFTMLTGYVGGKTANAEILNEKPMRAEILDKNFKKIGQWSEGLCPVLDPTSGMWGYVDKTGKYVIQPQYYEAAPFSEGLAAVKGVNGKYTFIDKTGKISFSGEFAAVGQRYFRSAIGFMNGLAVVKVDSNSSCKLIDKSGNTIKELDSKTYDIQKVRFENRGNIVTSVDNKTTIYDQQYNTLAKFEGYAPKQGGGSRLLFNYSTKYLLIQDKEMGIFAGAADGSKVFEQKVIPNSSMDNGFRIGITDDYIVVFKKINDIHTAAVFNFDGSTVIDYKYKEIYPITKDIFVAINNADVYGAIDKNGNELIPFSHGIKAFNSAAKDLLYERANSSGGLSYILNSETGKKAQHLDLKTISDIVIQDNYNAFIYGYRCEAGTFYDFNGIWDDKFEPLNCALASQSLHNVTDVKQFFNEGIIPVQRADKTGFTFAVITR